MRIAACCALLAGALVALARPAFAQESTYVEKQSTDGQDIRFKDDPMGAIADTPVGDIFRGFHPAKQFFLMRPRTTFVPEMLKSVEHI
jgi:hypothetical protein